jgi:hypothetical protein
MSGSMVQTVARPGQGNQGAGAGAAQGAASGAMAGSVFGPWGTAIGAVVGGVIGFASGALADKGKVHERMARKWAKQGKNREAAIKMRDNLRAFRMQRAVSMASIASETGGTQSSAPQGAISSMESQYSFGSNFAIGQMYIMSQYEKQMKKAGDNFNASKAGFGYLSAATSITSAFGGGGFGGASSKIGLTSTQTSEASSLTNALGAGFSSGFEAKLGS